MLKFDKKATYLVPVREKPILVQFEDSNVCPADFSIQCKYSKLKFKDNEMHVSCNHCYKKDCIIVKNMNNF